MGGILVEFTGRKPLPLHKAKGYFIREKIKMNSDWYCDFYKIKYYEGKPVRVFCDREARYKILLYKGDLKFITFLCSIHARYFKKT